MTRNFYGQHTFAEDGSLVAHETDAMSDDQLFQYLLDQLTETDTDFNDHLMGWTNAGVDLSIDAATGNVRRMLRIEFETDPADGQPKRTFIGQWLITPVSMTRRCIEDEP